MFFKKLSSILFLIVFFVRPQLTPAQIPTQTWRNHPYVSAAKGIAIADNFVYFFTVNGFFRLNKVNKAIETLTENDELNDKIVTALSFNPTENSLIVGYASGNLDVIKLNSVAEFDEITEINSLKNSAVIKENKKINKISVGNNRTFCATDFGLIELDFKTKQIKETYRNIGPNGSSVRVLDVKIANDSLFLKTPSGILGGSLSPNVNLLFYGNWKTFTNSNRFVFLTQLPINQLITKINDVAIDNQNYYWIADENNGLVSDFQGNWQAYKAKGIPETTGNLVKNEDTIYFNSESKLFKFLNNEWALSTENVIKQTTVLDNYNNSWRISDGSLVVEKNNDQYTYGQANGINGFVNAIALSSDDLIWVATNNGVYAVASSSDAVVKPQNAFAPIFGNQRLLLQQNVTSVSIDAGNRKWFGTTNGLFHFSENTDDLLNYFTTENSLLYDNQIITTKINNTGEVFVQSKLGVVSYQSDASTPTNSFEKVRLYPNPIRPNFSGVFTIDGLQQNTNIKITDVVGNVVATLVSNGGTAAWNLKLPDGRRASTGVYMVLLVSDNLQEKFVGKFAIVN